MSDITPARNLTPGLEAARGRFASAAAAPKINARAILGQS